MRRLLSLISLLVIAACSSTPSAKITHSWISKDIEQKQDLSGVLVLAISSKAESRQRFEREFTDALTKQGVRAVASYTLKGGAKITREDVKAMGEKENLDTVLITTFAGRDQEEVLHRGRTYYGVQPIYTGGGYYRRGGYYGRGGYGAVYEVAHVPDFYAQHKSLHLEANLYEISTEEHLWVAASGITETENTQTMLDSFIDAFMAQLKADKLLD
jgi:hypothetical protein